MKDDTLSATDPEYLWRKFTSRQRLAKWTAQRAAAGVGPGRIGSGTLEDDPKRTKQLTARDGA